jgi:hypothetical protein
MPEALVSRVQTGVRIEARLLNVLKALAALKGLTLGDLLEGIVLHAFEGRSAFSDPTLAQIAELRKIYGLELKADDSHQLTEAEPSTGRAGMKRPAAAVGKRRSGRSRR